MTSSTNFPTADDPKHLERLKALAKNAIADGQLSVDERQALRQALFADGKLTAEEIEVIRATFREKLGDHQLKFEEF